MDCEFHVRPTRLPPERLPVYAPHTPGKHALLRGYLNAWIPIIASRWDRLAIVDGFASAGRYRTNEKGSPLLMVDAWRGRTDRTNLRGKPSYFFIEKNRAYAQHLQAEVGCLNPSRGETIHVWRGQYAECFPLVVERLRSMGCPPTFAFIDPYGYKGNPFEHVLLLRQHITKAEALVYLPINHMARFVDTGITTAALNRVFGGESWRAAQDQGALDATCRELVRVFDGQMREAFDWVTAFRIEPKNRNDYYLFFGTNHVSGLRKMKEAMWDVDPDGGGTYAPQIPAPPVIQESLTGWDVALPAVEEVDQIAEDLLALLREEFGTHEFSIDQAETFTLCRTRYLDTRHLKKRTLSPAEKVDTLRVERPGKQGYPAGTTLRFVS
jgi:three-Cys-motif partner protein